MLGLLCDGKGLSYWYIMYAVSKLPVLFNMSNVGSLLTWLLVSKVLTCFYHCPVYEPIHLSFVCCVHFKGYTFYIILLTLGVGRGGLKGSDEPPFQTMQGLIIASYPDSLHTKPFQV